MRRCLLLAALVLAGCSVGGSPGHSQGSGTAAARASVTAERWPAPLLYQLDVSYDARRFALAGTERIELRNTGPQPLTSVWLRTWGNAFGGCRRRYVRVTVDEGGRAGAEKVGCTALEVRLSEPLAPGAGTTIALGIDVTAPPRPDRFGRFAGAAFFGNALPLLAVTDDHGLRLPPYTFRGESFYSLTARWAVALHLPSGVRAATTGTTRGGITRALARDFAIVAGPLREVDRDVGGVRVRAWRLQGRDADNRRALGLASTALAYYERLLGPYGRDELDVVEGPHSIARGSGIGMEYPELVLTPAIGHVLQHEVAHQWWHGIVGTDEYHHPWLDESFASYSYQRLARRDVECEPPTGRPRITDSMRVFDRAPAGAYGRVVYAGGSCALRTLEDELGRARFDRLLRGLVSRYRDGIMTSEDFYAAVDAAAPAGSDGRALLRRAGIDPG